MAPVSELSKSYEVLMVGRAISGIARGIAFSTVPLYVAEITNRKNLAFFQVSLNIFVFTVFFNQTYNLNINTAFH